MGFLHPLAIQAGPRISHRGTYRSCSPSETLARVSRFTTAYGITRIADITGLDRLGLPVVNVVRPLSKSVSVSTGKGATPDAARVSGLMESIEAHHAENIREHPSAYKVGELSGGAGRINLRRTPRHDDHWPGDTAMVPCLEAFDLMEQVATLCPYELISNDFTVTGSANDLGMLPKGSNGLASGNNLLEAITHALYEVIERDAISLFHYLFDRSQTFHRIDLDHPVFDGPHDLIEQVRSAGMEVHVWDITSDVGVPTAYCMIWEGLEASRSAVRATVGAGTHADPGVAISRAVTEAAQDRLTLIAGARDDLLAENYLTDRTRAHEIRRSLCVDERSPVPPAWPMTATTTTYDAELRRVCERLRRVGIDQVLAYDLSWPERPEIAVAKVVVPGLEAPHDDAGYVPGPRIHRALGLEAAA